MQPERLFAVQDDGKPARVANFLARKATLASCPVACSRRRPLASLCLRTGILRVRPPVKSSPTSRTERAAWGKGMPWRLRSAATSAARPKLDATMKFFLTEKVSPKPWQEVTKLFNFFHSS